MWRFIAALSEFPKPIVAAVRGAAIGIGATMLLHCDLVYAASDSRFSLPFTNLGLCPEAGSSLLLQQACGQRAAAQMLLLGEGFSASEALEMQFVTALLQPSAVQDHARSQAHALAAKPAGAVMATKRLLRFGHANRVAEQIREEIKAFGELVTQDAAKAKFASFTKEPQSVRDGITLSA